MKRIFDSREFRNYQISSLYESRGAISSRTIYASYTTVFLSHKHDDLDDLKDVIGFLQTQYGVKVYIDSRDPAMPPFTSGETAINIKSRIKQCNKFILLATNGAIESKWCNWELGFGDAQKFKDHIAIFPIKPSGATYKGTEYISAEFNSRENNSLGSVNRRLSNFCFCHPFSIIPHRLSYAPPPR